MKVTFNHSTGKAKEYPTMEKPEFKGDHFLHYGPWKQYEAHLSSLKEYEISPHLKDLWMKDPEGKVYDSEAGDFEIVKCENCEGNGKWKDYMNDKEYSCIVCKEAGYFIAESAISPLNPIPHESGIGGNDPAWPYLRNRLDEQNIQLENSRDYLAVLKAMHDFKAGYSHKAALDSQPIRMT